MYSTAQACKITRVSLIELNYWIHEGFILPSDSKDNVWIYTYVDLLKVRLFKSLSDVIACREVLLQVYKEIIQKDFNIISDMDFFIATSPGRYVFYQPPVDWTKDDVPKKVIDLLVTYKQVISFNFRRDVIHNLDHE